MKRVYTTANGRRINLDAIIAHNEDSIAVGNMKVNARGDELGPGGKIERTREQVMNDYYKLNTPVASERVPQSHKQTTKKDLIDDWVEPAIKAPISTEIEEPEPAQSVATDPKPLRGSLAGSVAKTQLPAEPAAKKTGPTRI